ncbi:MAG: hypothetical protein RL701_1637, partial [Pseudomonadota bacterium]
MHRARHGHGQRHRTLKLTPARKFIGMQRKPIEHGTISIHFVREALLAAQGRGVSVQAVLARASIPLNFLDEPLARVSARQFGSLWRELARRLDDEFFALDTRPVRPGAFALLCHALADCTDLKQVLRRMCRYTRVILNDMHASLEVRSGTVTLRLHDARSRTTPFAHATYFMVVYGLACWLIARRIPLVQCRLA